MSGVESGDGMTVRIVVDLTEFSIGAKRHMDHDWPRAVVEGFSELAEKGRDDSRALAARHFDLRSPFIPSGIRSTPNSAAQKAAAAHALKKYGDMNAAVFLRGASDPRKSLEFAAHHATGETRGAQDKYIAVPMKGVKAKGFRTAKGRVRKRWKPAQLLKHFNATGSVYTGVTTQGRRKLGYKGKGRKIPGKAFMIRSKRGEPLIARRISRGPKGSKNLEFLYILKTKARIQEKWGFVDGVYRSVGHRYSGVITKHVAMIRSR